MRQTKTTFDSVCSLLHVSGMDSPNRLAVGLCLGIWIGLLPKVSLLPWCVAGLAILSTANLATLIAGYLFGCLTVPLVDRLALPLGEKLLSLESLAPLFARSLDTPVLTHFGLHQSATLGSSSLWLLLFLPTFFLARALFNRLQPLLENWLATGPEHNRTVPSSTPTPIQNH